jgi:hypothetical protein
VRLTEDSIWITLLRQSKLETRDYGLGYSLTSNSDLQPVIPTFLQGVNIKLSFVGGNSHPRLEPFNQLNTVVSYFAGDDPAKWQTNVPVWGGIRYVDLYPGIDLEMTDENGNWAWRLITQNSSTISVDDHSFLQDVRLRIDGTDEMILEGDHLRFGTPVGEFSFPLLQIVAADGTPLNIPDVNPAVEGSEIITPFSTAQLLPSPLFVPPQDASDLVYSTFLGGSDNNDSGDAIAIDEAGNAYVMGVTYSSDFPATPGAFDTSYNGSVDLSSDVFVAKLNTIGAGGLVYATFLGGGSNDVGFGIAVDNAGDSYVVGYTQSSNFPTTPGAFDTTYNYGFYDAFVAKLNVTGTGLVYSTFLGGSDSDLGNDIAVDEAGNAYVVGSTQSSDFPVTAGAFDTSYNGGQDVFLAKLNASGAGSIYATFLGGSSSECSTGRCGIAIDSGGNVYTTGETASNDFPTTQGAFDRSYNGSVGDVFVAKLNANGTNLVYATFVGGSNWDTGSDIAVDGAGSAYVVGYTQSSDFPTTLTAFDRSYNGYDAFAVKLNSSGTGLVYATFLGGTSADCRLRCAIAIDAAGSAYMVGETQSSNFPVTPGAFDTSYNGMEDAFMAKLSADGTRLAYATFLGGAYTDDGNAIAVDNMGNAYVTGWTESYNFPTTAGAFDTSYNGSYDAFVAKMATGGGAGPTYSISGRVTDADENPISGVTLSAGMGHITTTDNAGIYTLSGLAVGNYTVAPSKSGYALAPASRTVRVPPSAQAQDFRGAPISVEDIQADQVLLADTDPSDDQPIPLIAGKPTLVRAYVSCGVVGCLYFPDDTGALQVYGSVGQTLGSPLPPASFQSTLLGRILNFVIPPGWVTDTVTMVAEFNGATRSEPVSFQPARTLKIAYIPVHYEPSYGEPPCNWHSNDDPNHDRIAQAYEWALKVYPTDKIEYLPWPKMDWEHPLRTGRFCDEENRRDDNSIRLKSFLTVRWALAQEPRPNYVFGWLPDGAFGGGSSDPNWPGRAGGGVAAFGDDNSVLGQRIFAHEIGHLLGRRHTLIRGLNQETCENPDWGLLQNHPESIAYYDWPYPTAKIQEWGLDSYGFSWINPFPGIDPDTTYDYMSYCWFDGSAWTSPHTFRHIYTETLSTLATNSVAQPLSASQPYLIVSGLVYTNGATTIDPVWVFTSTTAIDHPSDGTDYCLELQNTSGMSVASHCFDLSFFDYETGSFTDVDGFALMLPYSNNIARLALKKGGQELAVRLVSANAPVVTVLSPNGGEIWAAGDTYTITWAANDADGDSLTYGVLYSPDGNNWVPVGTAITETELAVSAAELAGGNGAKVRVMATDGVNTSADESDAPFAVGRKGPQAFILSPERDGAIPLGAPLFLQGYAYDLEDGTLGESSLRWTSSHDGDLGIGDQVLVTLSEGRHVITLTATDSDGNMATDSLNVLVGSKVYLPIIMKKH